MGFTEDISFKPGFFFGNVCKTVNINDYNCSGMALKAKHAECATRSTQCYVQPITILTVIHSSQRSYA